MAVHAISTYKFDQWAEFSQIFLLIQSMECREAPYSNTHALVPTWEWEYSSSSTQIEALFNDIETLGGTSMKVGSAFNIASEQIPRGKASFLHRINSNSRSCPLL